MKPQTVKPGHRVFVEWVDSCASHRWHELDTNDPVPVGLIITSGIGLCGDKEAFHMTDSVDIENKNIRGMLTIPWVAITKFKQYEQLVKIGVSDGTSRAY